MLGLSNSLIYSVILILINNLLADNPSAFLSNYGLALYSTLLVVFFLVSRMFLIQTVRSANEIIYHTELKIINKLRNVGYRVFEKIGSNKVYAVVNDTKVLSEVPEAIVGLTNSIIIVICGLTFMVFKFWVAGLSLIIFMVAILIFYMYRNQLIFKDLNRVRDNQDTYYGYLRDFLSGFKQVKVSPAVNSKIYHNYIKKNRDENLVLSLRSYKKYMTNQLIGNTSWYVIIGVILFGFSTLFEFEKSELTFYVFILIFIMGPVATLVNSIPQFTQFTIAIQRIKQFENEFDVVQEEPMQKSSDVIENFESLHLKDVAFSYQDESENNFKLGPVNLEIKKGELVFITGGNGSGKSTLFQLMTTLYTAEEGKVLLNGEVISADKKHLLKGLISPIFTDHYIFKNNYQDFSIVTQQEKIEKLIDEMKLKGIINLDFEKGYLNTDLSKGQQKRLALILCLMEEKPVILLDEWAAEQDPEFRKYFYEVLLEEFKKRGKTIIAITHDDHYFRVADRIIKLNAGKIQEENHSIAIS